MSNRARPPIAGPVISRLLPLLLLVSMLTIAVAVELVVFDTLLWLPKLPLAVLLVTPFVLRRPVR